LHAKQVLFASKQNSEKIGQKGALPRSRDVFLNFGNSYYLWKGRSYRLLILQIDLG